MSDISVLVAEHKTALALAQSLNKSLIILKKARLHLAGWTDISQDEIRISQLTLSRALQSLQVLLLAKDDVPAVDVPGAILAQLQVKHRGDMEYYLADIITVTNRLSTNISWQETDFALLDELAALADDAATQVYRRLMRM